MIILLSLMRKEKMIDLLDEVHEALSTSFGKTVREIYESTTMAETRDEVIMILQLLVAHDQVVHEQDSDGYRRYRKVSNHLERDDILEDIEVRIRASGESVPCMHFASSNGSSCNEEDDVPAAIEIGMDVETQVATLGADLLQEHLFRTPKNNSIREITLPINLAQVQTDGALRYLDSTGKIKSLEDKQNQIIDIYKRNEPSSNMIVRERGEKVIISQEQIKLLTNLIAIDHK